MVIAYHLIATAYACWLPNDPRGSTSTTIRQDVLKELGELHYGRKRVQPASSTIRRFYARADPILQHELLEFQQEERALIAGAFGETIRREAYTCYACEIMRDHFHICIRKHKHLAEEMISKLQETSRVALIDAGRRPSEHPVWGGPGWKVFLDEPEDIWRTIRYIEGNPVKAGWASSTYDFVTAYDNWPFHKSGSRNRKRG